MTRLLLLVALLAIAALPLGPPPARAQIGGAPVMDAPSAKGLAEAGVGILVDLRTPRERRETGTPRGSVAVPLQDDGLSFRPGFADEVLAAAGGDPGRPVALIDADGRRSQRAAAILAARGFAQVFAVGEGLFGSNLGPGWVARGLPMEPCGGC